MALDLGSILSLGASLFGGGSAPTGGAAPSAGGLDWGSILSAIGKTAGSFKATPNEGASRKDIEKANRFNLLAGLLGGGAQIAGGVMSQQRRGEAYNALSDILAGKATTTGQAMAPSEPGAVGAMPTVTTEAPQSSASRIMALGKQYPELSDKFLELGIKQQQSEQDASQKLAEMLRKAQPSLQDRLAATNIAQMEGWAPGDIPSKRDEYLSAETARRLGQVPGTAGISPTLRGLGGPDTFADTSPAPTPTVTTTPPPTTEMTSPVTVDQVIKKAQEGGTMTEDELTNLVNSGAIERQGVIKADGTQGFLPSKKSTPLLSPGTVSQTYPDTAEGRRQQRADKASKLEAIKLQTAELGLNKTQQDIDLARSQEERAQKDAEIRKRTADYQISADKEKTATRTSNEMVAQADKTGVAAARRYLQTAYNLLSLENPSGENHRAAIVALQKTIDPSQVTLGEAVSIDTYLRSRIEKLKNEIDQWGGKPFPPYKGDQLKALKADALEIGKAIKTTMDEFNDKFDQQTEGEWPKKRPFSLEQTKSTENILNDLTQQIRGVTPVATPTGSTAQAETQSQVTSPIAGLGGSREQQIRFIGIR
jgi:hypothetical protein